jgi:hypothetical protein
MSSPQVWVRLLARLSDGVSPYYCLFEKRTGAPAPSDLISSLVLLMWSVGSRAFLQLKMTSFSEYTDGIRNKVVTHSAIYRYFDNLSLMLWNR